MKTQLFVLILLITSGAAALGQKRYQPAHAAGGEHFGMSVSPLDDVNDDGYQEVLVGAPGVDSVHVYSGADGTFLYEARSGQPSGGRFGASVLGVPDCGNDGTADFLVSAPGAHRVVDDVGLPTPTPFVELRSGLDGALVWRSEGEPGSQFGWRLAAIDDTDGDGIHDFAVSTTRSVELLSGATGTRRYSLTANVPNFGYSIAGIQDCDEDGIGDLAVGAPSSSGGSLHLFSGADGHHLSEYSASGFDTLGLALTRLDDLGNTLAVGARKPESNQYFVLAMSMEDGSLLWESPSSMSSKREWLFSRSGLLLSPGGQPSEVRLAAYDPDQAHAVLTLTGDATSLFGAAGCLIESNAGDTLVAITLPWYGTGTGFPVKGKVVVSDASGDHKYDLQP